MAKRKSETRAQQIGRVLEARRVELGLSRAEVARRAGMHAQNLGLILDGQSKPDRPGATMTAGVLVRLARALGTAAEVVLAQAGPHEITGDVVAAIPADAAAELAGRWGFTLADACGMGS